MDNIRFKYWILEEMMAPKYLPITSNIKAREYFLSIGKGSILDIEIFPNIGRLPISVNYWNISQYWKGSTIKTREDPLKLRVPILDTGILDPR